MAEASQSKAAIAGPAGCQAEAVDGAITPRQSPRPGTPDAAPPQIANAPAKKRAPWKSWATTMAGTAIARHIALVWRTSRRVNEPVNLNEYLTGAAPSIIAMWHGQFMMLPAIKLTSDPLAAMVARHGDAELIGRALGHFDIELIRGSGAGARPKDRGGAAALRAAARVLRGGTTLAMTADVPPGPARRSGTGIVILARLSGRPIIPLACATSNYHALKTWSRMTINLPWSRLACVAGRPISVPPDADAAMIEVIRTTVEQELDRVTLRAYELAGADPARATPPRPMNPAAAPLSPGVMLRAYRQATRALRPCAGLILRRRAARGKEDPRRMGERLGQPGRPRPPGRLIWFHAASVGETNAVLPVVSALLAERPDLSALLTTGTTTSAALAASRLPPRTVHQFVPLDAAAFVRSFLDHWQPSLAVFTESEIWPNLILETTARGVPMALVNAIISPKSFRSWKRARTSATALFNRFDVVLAQNEVLARRLTELGARRVIVSGNLKIDAPPPPVDAAAHAALSAALGDRPRFIAASTHAGEDAIVAAAHERLEAAYPGMLTIIAPRHPERGAAITALVEARGLRASRRSLGALPGAGTQIYVADTIGELGTLYALNPIAFIGGSLIAHGGQNPIEAVRHGAAILTGPHTRNQRDAYAALFRHKGAREVADAAGLAAAVAELLGNDPALKDMRNGAARALATLSGALPRTVEALTALVPSVAIEAAPLPPLVSLPQHGP